MHGPPMADDIIRRGTPPPRPPTESSPAAAPRRSPPAPSRGGSARPPARVRSRSRACPSGAPPRFGIAALGGSSLPLASRALVRRMLARLRRAVRLPRPLRLTPQSPLPPLRSPCQQSWQGPLRCGWGGRVRMELLGRIPALVGWRSRWQRCWPRLGDRPLQPTGPGGS